MEDKEQDISKKFSLKRIMIPVIIGLGAATFLLYLNLSSIRFEKVTAGDCGEYTWVDANGDGVANVSDEEEFVKAGNCEGEYVIKTYEESLGEINWTWISTFWIFMAFLGMVVRDLAYMYRIRILTDKRLSWKQSFNVIMLWEFASPITPSVVGGSGVAMFILNREGIKLGKSTAIVMVSALLDELFYITMVVLLFIFVGQEELFPVSMQKTIFGITFGTQGIFWVGYIFIFLLTSTIIAGVFWRPRAFKYILIQIFKLPFLKKWRYKVIEIGDDIITTSRELKGKNKRFWGKSFLATYVSWTSRYWVVNFLILAFVPVSDHLLIYARQLVMWVIMLISPTPGSSGVAELAFSGFLQQFIPLGLAGALALLWRLISYYPYLFIGAIILPRWLRSTANRQKI